MRDPLLVLAFVLALMIASLTIGGLVMKGLPPGPLASESCTHFEVRGDFKAPWVRCIEDGGWASLAGNQPGSLKGRTITLEVMK